jgi:tRNA(fMet)-specific endonuclease VapC
MQEPSGTVALCSVVKAELYYGAYKSQQRTQTLARLERFIRNFHSYTFDDAAADVYGRIRADLAAQGTPIGPNDLMIAATALANNLIVVTHNTREFARVAGLSLEDWT